MRPGGLSCLCIYSLCCEHEHFDDITLHIVPVRLLQEMLELHGRSGHFQKEELYIFCTRFVYFTE